MLSLSATGSKEAVCTADREDAYAESSFGSARHELTAAELVEFIQLVFHDFLEGYGFRKRGWFTG